MRRLEAAADAGYESSATGSGVRLIKGTFDDTALARSRCSRKVMLVIDWVDVDL